MTYGQESKSYCANCGFVVVGVKCPWCQSSVSHIISSGKEHASRNAGRRPRVLWKIGVCALVASCVLAVVDNRFSQSNNSAQDSDNQDVRLSPIPTSALIEPTTTKAVDTSSPIETLVSVASPISTLSVVTTVQIVPSSSVTRPSVPKTSTTTLPTTTLPTTTLPTTTLPTTPPVGNHGKAQGSVTYWSNNSYKVLARVSADDIIIFADFPTFESTDPSCIAGAAPIYSIQEFYSQDGITLTREGKKYEVPGEWFTCNTGGWGNSIFSKRGWYDPILQKSSLAYPPPAYFFKFKITNYTTGGVVESPWVRIDLSVLP